MTDQPGTGPGTAQAPGVAPRFVRRFDERLSRLGLTGRFARDCLLAAVVTVVTFALMGTLFWAVAPAEGLAFDPAEAWLVVAACCVQAMLLCLRRVRPVLCLALVVGLQVAVLTVVPPEVMARGLPPLIAAYTVGTLLPLRTALLVSAGAVVVDAAGAVTAALAGTSGLLGVVVGHVAAGSLTYFGATFVGNYVVTHRRNVELLRSQAAEAVRAQQEKVRAAIGAERARMARELHDVAAHHLSGMVVQAAAAERLVDRDPEAAKEGVAWIRAQGKETLDNLRLVVGVLRGRPGGLGEEGGPDPGDQHAPVPGLAMLDDLVRTARGLDTSVDLVREGSARPVPPIADVALYRTVQECLSNARQHAPGAPVRVVLRYLPRAVALEVVNEPATRRAEPGVRTSSGVGLIGMRERAQLIGAAFTAGPTAAGGWSVAVTLPTGRDDLPAPSPTTKGTEPA
ncbi:hypothetical protein AWW66_20315 [Micromonospora rosaria]|uniref:histidine kinase n=1 Tax=Micromonospora rosaria TaxID=47874 RepID=A0A136PNT7_9ACTN|nr:histidine kinase [Micromonospora rosaria]KXK60160.1 hypothetical protein AWW66_20315 [Micromonospora rosaria]